MRTTVEDLVAASNVVDRHIGRRWYVWFAGPQPSFRTKRAAEIARAGIEAALRAAWESERGSTG